MTYSSAYIALLGGSFNPPHAGHFRMALEVWENLSPESLLFIPCASPPLKGSRNLLPFSLRVSMLTSVLERLPGMELCTLEQERTGPSYTVDTLVALGKSLPHKRLLFIMGSSDLAILPAWHQWERISELADLLILPRNGATVVNFTQTVYSLWPEAVPTVFSNKAVQAAFTLPTAGKVLFLPQPMLEISSSLVRSRWLSGKKVDFLVPPSIIELLICNEALVESLWQAKLSKEALI